MVIVLRIDILSSNQLFGLCKLVFAGVHSMILVAPAALQKMIADRQTPPRPNTA
jgi:hypothetical protein